MVLSEDEHEFVQKLAEAWMPRGGEPALSGADAQLGDFIDQTLQPMPPVTQKLLKLLMQALDDSTLPTHMAPYRRLWIKDRQRVLRGWIHHENRYVRLAMQALLVLIAIGWTTHPDVVKVLEPSMRCTYGR